MAANYNPKIVTDGLILCLDAANAKSYPGSGSTWTDLSTSRNDGTLTNGPTYTAGANGYFTLDGTDDTITTNINITSTPARSNWTYEVWTTMTSFPTAVSPANGFGRTDRDGVLMGATYYSGAAIYWDGASDGNSCSVFGYLRGNDGYRFTSPLFSMSLNTTYQFTYVNNYTANTILFYVNGALHGSAAAATQEYNATNIVTAGNIGFAKPQVDGGGTANYSYYPGRIHAAKIYNRALSAFEVSQNYSALRGRYGV